MNDDMNAGTWETDKMVEDFMRTKLQSTYCDHHNLFDMLTYQKCIVCGFTIKHEKQGRLVLLGTEIGNAFDITPRVLDAIITADYIICEHEDSFRQLCESLRLSPIGAVLPYDEFSDQENKGIEKLQWLYDEIENGLNAVMIADQGMPMIMDPGDYIVKGAIKRGISVTAFPGPDAPVTALNISGLNAWDFTFIGSLPHDFKVRDDIFYKLIYDNKTNIYFDRDHTLMSNLTHLCEVIGESRKIAICFNMTRSDQNIVRGTVKEVVEHLMQNGYDKPRRDAEWLIQLTVVVEGAEPKRAHI
jgi:16S rRNA (cytidine1402-2'-O)-methyltransferase